MQWGPAVSQLRPPFGQWTISLKLVSRAALYRSFLPTSLYFAENHAAFPAGLTTIHQLCRAAKDYADTLVVMTASKSDVSSYINRKIMEFRSYPDLNCATFTARRVNPSRSATSLLRYLQDRHPRDLPWSLDEAASVLHRTGGVGSDVAADALVVHGVEDDHEEESWCDPLVETLRDVCTILLYHHGDICGLEAPWPVVQVPLSAAITCLEPLLSVNSMPLSELLCKLNAWADERVLCVDATSVSFLRPATAYAFLHSGVNASS